MEKTVSSETVFQGRLLKVERLGVELDDGKASVREVVRFPEVAVVLAIDEQDRLLLVRQFRKPIESCLIEAVAGKVDPGESPDAAAARELKEETGYACQGLKKIGVSYPTPGYCDEKQHYFLARVSGDHGSQSGDDDEKIDLVRMTGNEVAAMSARGEPIDGKLLTAVAFMAMAEGVMEEDETIVFVSGHMDLTPEEFDEHYRSQVLAHANSGHHIVVGDARGCDLMVQTLLSTQSPDVRFGGATVYHMFDSPRNNIGWFPTVGGFKSDEERDAAMTAASTVDLAWVRPGRENSGTARNLARRRA